MTAAFDGHGDAAPPRGVYRPNLGAHVVDGGVRFRVWAPDAEQMDVQISDALVPMQRDERGTWTATVPGVGAGVQYRYRIDRGGAFPDPYSRSQPDGPHGPSEVVDPNQYAWHDDGWRGIAMQGLVVYELHVGAYTAAGTFDALIGELDALATLGVTAIELMPVAEFPGGRNWGYDGVDLFAPSRIYGGPDGLKRLVDAAHQRGLGVILDVVYNHFGPDGNYLLQYAADYLTDRHATPWGDAVNFDGARSEMVRRLVIDNACYWLSEYHIDGLRLDAAFAITDTSPRHILEELAAEARASAAPRSVVLIAETHAHDGRYLRPAMAGGYGLDAVWSDDFHHVVHTIASHEHGGYYADYAGTLDELARTINRGWLFEGQQSPQHGAADGAPPDGLDAWRFICCIQNHDQVGNRAFGRRFEHLVGAGAHRMWSALLLLLPYTPLLFMGQEFAASSRFYYFTDHKPDLGRDVTKGRRAEFARMAGFDDPAQQREIPDPQSPQTFLESKLNLRERDEGTGAETWRMYAELLTLRRSDAVVSRQDRSSMRAYACGDKLLLVHLRHGREHRLIAANAGVGVDAAPAAINVPRAIASMHWRELISTDERRFGGSGDRMRFDERLISMPPQSVVLWQATQAPLPIRLVIRLGRLIRRGRRG
jgi:maltooligosyltrehalose trehalohydrolase